MVESPDKRKLQRQSGLLWKSIERQSEVQAGLVRLNKEVTIRILANRPTEFLLANRFDFSQNMKAFLKTVVTMEPEKLEYFIFRVFDSYMRELQYLENRNHQFSIDILFQVIETLTLERESKGIVDGTINLGADSLTKSDLENIANHIKAFNLLSAHFQKIGNIKKTIELTDVIILKTATLNPMVTVMALDNMFSLILAQNVLASKYALRNLLSGWMDEYGFTKEQVVRIVPLFPGDSSLIEFRAVYTKAMQTLLSQQSDDLSKDMDLFMLRTVCNYFTSWLNRVANQIHPPKALTF